MIYRQHAATTADQILFWFWLSCAFVYFYVRPTVTALHKAWKAERRRRFWYFVLSECHYRRWVRYLSAEIVARGVPVSLVRSYKPENLAIAQWLTRAVKEGRLTGTMDGVFVTDTLTKHPTRATTKS